MRVISVQSQKLPAGRSTSPAWLRFMAIRNNITEEPEICLEDRSGAEFVKERQPTGADIVVRKWRSSAFVGTNLDMILRVHRISMVVCCGFITQGCVESTARDAGFHDYYPVVVEDAVANHDLELHTASLLVQRSRYDVLPSAAILRIWEARAPQYAGPAV